MKIITMRPSHRCVLKAVLDVMKPKKLIEFGSGPNSTALLHERIPQFISYENHQEWVAKMTADVPGVDIRHLPVPVKSFKIYPGELNKDTRTKIYDAMKSVVEDTNVVFIDSYASTRIYALLAFIGHFDIAICHDSEKLTYWYEKAEKKMSGHIKITIQPPARVPYIDVIVAPRYLETCADSFLPSLVDAIQRECMAMYGGLATVIAKKL